MGALIALLLLGFLIGLLLAPQKTLGCLGGCALIFIVVMFILSGIGHLFIIGNIPVGLLFLGIGVSIIFMRLRRH